MTYLWKKIQQYKINIMGPLSNVWKTIKNVENESSGEMTLPLEEVATNLNKSVQLLGQAFQSNITTITMHFLLS